MTYLVVQRLNLLLLLTFTNFVCIRNLKVLRRNIYEPLRLDSSYVVTILPGCQNKFVVNEPFRITVEKCRRWMDVHRGTFNKGLVTFLGVFLRGVPEKARADRSADTIEVFARGENVMFISVKRGSVIPISL